MPTFDIELVCKFKIQATTKEHAQQYIDNQMKKMFHEMIPVGITTIKPSTQDCIVDKSFWAQIKNYYNRILAL
jgi:hypothetical protein